MADSWVAEKYKMLNRVIESYRKSPCFEFVYPVIEKSILFEKRNLFEFILNSLNLVKEYLEIHTPLITSSTIPIDHRLEAEKKVVAICKARQGDVYLNPIGGVELYSKDEFGNEGINLHFLKTNDFTYKQFDNDFISFLSIIDVMMFNSKEAIKEYLNSFFTLI